MKVKNIMLALAATLTLVGCDQIDEIMGGGSEGRPAKTQGVRPENNSGAANGEIEVGDKSTEIKDAIALRRTVFDNPNRIDVYLFNFKLTNEQRQKFLTLPYYNDSDIAEALGGHQDVLTVWLQFDEKAQSCDEAALKGLTVIFEKNKDFEFNVNSEGPINWAYSHNKTEPISNLGFNKLSCSFEHGGQLNFQLKNSWRAERSMFQNMLPEGTDELDFKWDLEVITKVNDPEKVRPPRENLILNNHMVQASDIIWTEKSNTLGVILLTRAPDADGKYSPNDIAAEYYISYQGKPADLSEMTKSMSMTIYNKNKGYVNEIAPSSIYISGKPEVGEEIIFQSIGEAKGNIGDEPNINWNFNITAKLNKVN